MVTVSLEICPDLWSRRHAAPLHQRLGNLSPGLGAV